MRELVELEGFDVWTGRAHEESCVGGSLSVGRDLERAREFFVSSHKQSLF